jgi:excisionase family DNA binding protein
MDEDRLFDAKAAAAYLGGLSVYTVHAWLSQGRLRRVKIGARTMVRKSELDRLIAEGDGAKGPQQGRKQAVQEQPQQ